MQQLGRYKLGPVLGEGGAGRVYRAILEGPGGFRMPVALKVLHDGTEELRREARIGGLLRHRNLVDVYEVDRVDDTWICALELCDGTLADHLPLPPRAVLDVGLSVCAALQYAHAELGLIHLDLKPENLLLKDGVVKVADLGIARAEGFEAERRIRGTPAYMAPEQARGGDVDARADIYALGVTLVELATGSRPRSSETMDLDSLTASLDQDEPEVHTTSAGIGIPEWLAPVVDRCLAPDVGDRWPDIQTLADALSALQVGGPDLRQALGVTEVAEPEPPSPSGNLPLTEPILGRSAELGELGRRLDRPGVLTLKGPAGIGKTRLAVEVARQWSVTSGGQAWFCDLSRAEDARAVLSVLGKLLGIRLGGDRERQVARVGTELARRGELVLVLDNYEQLVADADLVDAWRRLAPEARLLVTSRVGLGLADEAVYEVGALGPDPAVSLLVARALDRGVELEVDADLHELATRLEGIPLALELAAGRLGVLSVTEVLDRLSLSLLRSASGDRHGTLEAALDWSWELLDEVERSALSQLSVFVGGFSLVSAEDVLELEAGSVLDVIGALMDRSLVRAVSSDRFSMLVSVREYARARLPDPRAVEARHGAHFERVYQRVVDEVVDRHHRRRVLGPDRDNLVAGVRRAVERGDPVVAARLLKAAWALIEKLGPYDLAVDLAESVAAMPELVGSSVAATRHTAGLALLMSGRERDARVQFEASLASARTHGLRKMECDELRYLGVLDALRCDWDGATRHLEQAHAIAVELGDRRWAGVMQGDLGNVHRDAGRPHQARDHYERALQVALEFGDRDHMGVMQGNLGNVCLDLGLFDQAMTHWNRALQTHRAVGNRRSEALMMSNIGTLHARAGRMTEARHLLEHSLEISEQLGDRRTAGLTLVHLAEVAIQDGRARDAEPLLERGTALVFDTGDPALKAHALAVRARMCLALSDRAGAMSALRRAEETVPPGAPEAGEQIVAVRALLERDSAE